MTVISYKDLPQWAKDILTGLQMRPNGIEVSAAVTHRLPGNWHDYDVRRYWFWDGERLAGGTAAANGDTYLNANNTERALAAGAEVTFKNINQMVLVTSTYPLRAYLFVHADAMPKLLAATPDLSAAEKLVLFAARAYKSSYGGQSRQQMALHDCNYQGFAMTAAEYRAAMESARAKGLLNKAGAITVKGKNAVGNVCGLHDVFKGQAAG